MRKKTPIRSTFKGLMIIVAALGGAIIANMLSNQSVQMQVAAIDEIMLDQHAIATTLSEAVQYETVSHRDIAQTQFNRFSGFLQFLEKSFPMSFRSLKVEPVNQYSLLLTWQGSENTKRPVLFLAHYDVVAAENVADWTHPPFSGAIAEDYVWGRGSMDDKSAIITQLTAVEYLLMQGYQPKRTLIFAYGHDEEVGGQEGARLIAAELERRSIKPEVMFDEGMPITNGVLKGISQPAALIGVSEKGYLTLELTVEGDGGHSSSPPPHSAVGILAKAITKIEDSPMPARLSGPVGKMFDALSPEMAPVQKAVLSNRWLFGPILEKQLSGKNSTNALIRTTAAATMFQGSLQANVLPHVATASVNFRIVPGDNVEGVIAHVEKTIDDPRVKIHITGNAIEPARISSTQSAGFKAIAKTVREIFPDTLTAPALLIASTDSKHYLPLVEDAYRFRPIWVAQEDIKRFHGVDERISVENLLKMTQYKIRLMQNLDG